ncbi:MAG: DUF2237 domain-containing protein [Acidobacteriota bacterium]
MEAAKNVMGGPLDVCCKAPMTGFYRNGRCDTGPEDLGVHVVCAEVTEEFLTFSRSRGNDLTSPVNGFPGLVAGDRWCLCVSRWKEAHDAGVAPPVILSATHEAALEVVALDDLLEHAIDLA